MNNSITCPECLERITHWRDYAPGNLARPEMGHARAFTADGSPALCILPHLGAVALGRKGGQSKSPAKQAAVRLNGRKGGRKIGTPVRMNLGYMTVVYPWGSASLVREIIAAADNEDTIQAEQMAYLFPDHDATTHTTTLLPRALAIAGATIERDDDATEW